MADRRFTFLVIVLSTLGYLTTDIYLPSMPSMTEYFQTTNTYVQLTIPAYMLSYGLSPLYFGPLSDKLGRKPIIIGGLIASLIGTLVILFAQSIELVILGRFLQGLTLGAVNVASRTVTTDKFKGRDFARFNSIMTLFVPLILALGPPIGGWIQEHSYWRMVFVALLSYQSVVLLLAIVLLEETGQKTEHPTRHYFKAYVGLCKNRVFMAYGSLTAWVMIGITVYFTVSPYLFQNYLHMTPLAYGCLSFFMSAAVIFSAVLNIRLLSVISSHKILYLSACVMLLAGGALYGAHLYESRSVSVLVACCVIYFASLNLSFSNSIANAFMQIESNYGAATALITSGQMLASMIASTVISLLPENNFMPLVYGFLGVAILFLICTIYANHHNPKIT